MPPAKKKPATPSGRAPLSRRVRFDVFKRDEFTCQYCGAHPPAAVLECDHIHPVAEGGSDDLDNLVTACFACNRGKGAVPLAKVPQSLAEKAAEIADREEQLRGYSAVLEARRQRLEDEAWRVLGILFPGQDTVQRDDLLSVRRFVERLGVHEVLDAAEVAASKRIYGRAFFRYFCGVCWSKVREREAQQ